jgi:hypothetical protein
VRLELTTSRLTVGRANQLRHGTKHIFILNDNYLMRQFENQFFFKQIYLNKTYK